MIKHFLGLAAAAALAAAPTVAAANTASALSVTQDGAAASSEGGFFDSPEAAIGAGIFGIIAFVGILAVAGVFDDDDGVSI